MKIFKFRDLRSSTDREHFLPIIQENKMWCAAPDSLKDENEFNFDLDYEPSVETPRLLAAVVRKFGHLGRPEFVANHALESGNLQDIVDPIKVDLIKQCRESIGVTSFSEDGSASWLWREYGGRGNGAKIEFELSDASVGNTFHLVEYATRRIFHIDALLRSQLSGAETVFKHILCTKTRHWEDEQEIRFIGKKPDVSFVLDAPITSVTFGEGVPARFREQYSRICSEKGIEFSWVGEIESS